MNRTPARRSSLFLLECIIAILFFILTATVCVRFFAESYTLSKKSEDLTMAVHITTSYVEEFRATDEFLVSTKIYFDENWMECDKAEAAHTLTVTISSKNDMTTGHFQMDDIYELSLDKYIGGGH